MAKRTEEKPYRPLDASLVQAVMQGAVAEEPMLVVREIPQATQSRELFSFPQAHSPMPPQPSPHVRRTAPKDDVREEFAVERMDREKRVLVTRSEERALERVIANIGGQLGTSLQTSHVLRSFIRLLINSEAEILEKARLTGRTIRPPNGDLVAIEAFEKIVAHVVHSGLKGARQFR